MGALLDSFDSPVAQVIASCGVLVFLVLRGGARVIRAIAELVRARGVSAHHSRAEDTDRRPPTVPTDLPSRNEAPTPDPGLLTRPNDSGNEESAA